MALFEHWGIEMNAKKNNPSRFPFTWLLCAFLLSTLSPFPLKASPPRGDWGVRQDKPLHKTQPTRANNRFNPMEYLQNTGPDCPKCQKIFYELLEEKRKKNLLQRVEKDIQKNFHKLREDVLKGYVHIRKKKDLSGTTQESFELNENHSENWDSIRKKIIFLDKVVPEKTDEKQSVLQSIVRTLYALQNAKESLEHFFSLPIFAADEDLREVSISSPSPTASPDDEWLFQIPPTPSCDPS